MNLTGRTLGKYQLLERLGQGGMAQVYKAVQPTIDRMVAVKILHSHLAQSDDLLERFKREARALGQLQHPHIVQVIDFDAQDDLYFMVVDFVPGKTLRGYLDERKKLLCGEALLIAEQIADALAYAHRRGTIHRDVKPGNVIFKEQEQGIHIVLTDFGVGRMLNDVRSRWRKTTWPRPNSTPNTLSTSSMGPMGSTLGTSTWMGRRRTRAMAWGCAATCSGRWPKWIGSRKKPALPATSASRPAWSRR